MRNASLRIITVIMFLALCSFMNAPSVLAQGGIIISPVDIHFEVVDPALPTVTNVQQLTFFGDEYRNTSDVDGSGAISGGDTSQIDGVFAITGFISNGFIVVPPGFGSTWEITGTYVGLQDVTLPVSVPGTINYIATPNIGIVTLYVSTDMTQPATALTGLGYDDGTVVAQYLVSSGGGVYRTISPFDGSRDMDLLKQSSLAGFFVPDIQAAVIDSNLDADSNNNGIGGDFPIPSNWQYPVATPEVNFPWSYYVFADGSMRFGTPECGNGEIDPDETCDPPGSIPDPANYPNNVCRDTCTYCGDGEKNNGEQCDPEDTTDPMQQFCNDQCVYEPYCGDGISGNTPGETCDPPGSVPDTPAGNTNECRNGGSDYQCTYCGDGIRQDGAGEMCDDGNNINGDGCNTDCQEENCSILVDKTVDCGSGPVDQQLVSADDDGINGCSADNTDVITVSYSVRNTGDVPLVNCTVTDSNAGIIPPALITSISPGVTSTFGPVNTPLICSDALEAGEPDTLTVTCDCAEPNGPLGDRSAIDEATFECLPICGDGNIDTNLGETCDPPGSFPADGEGNECRNGGSDYQCTYCGDGIKQEGAGEECDFNDQNDPLVQQGLCDNTCNVIPYCGDSNVDSNLGETCDPPGSFPADGEGNECRNGGSDYQCTYCGDGIKQEGAGEECDFNDQNDPLVQQGLCDNTCNVIPYCGDGIPGNTPGETCDPPGSFPADGEGNECRNGGSDYQCTYCGDGVLQEGAGEECDFNDSDAPDNCQTDCTLEPQCEIIVTKTCVVIPPPPDDGGHGCTPGYWKQDQHFGSWVGFSQSDDYETVFGVDASFTMTLLAVLEQGSGGEMALGRHAVAALLNAANPDVDYFEDVAGVIALVQDAYATGDFETTKDILDLENNSGCGLGNNTDDDDSGVIALVVNSDGSTTYDLVGAKECTVLAGTEVTYEYKIENTGPVNISIVEVIDDPDPGDPFEVPGSPVQNLAPGEMVTLMSTAVINETTVNTATVTGNPGPQQCMAMDTAQVIVEEDNGGGQGCTPGKWKQEQHFGFWVGYSQNDDYETVFGVDASFTITLLGALEQGGGDEMALGRHAVAALLNAANPNIDYFQDEAGVIALVQSAYATGDFEPTKNLLDFENNSGCDLGKGSAKKK